MNPKDTNKDPLAQGLISSAEDLSPSYSEHLHQRTMRAIRAQQAWMTLKPSTNRLRAIATVAAVLLVAVTLWYITSNRQSPAPPQEIAFHVPDASDLIRRGSQPLNDALSSIDGSGLTQFEQDARSLARFIANQFPQSDPRSSARPNQPKAQPGT